MTESGDSAPSSGSLPGSGADEPAILGERYELGGLLGRGGMADVRSGRDRRLGRTVAIKLLRPDLASDESFQARFRREAQSAAALNHPSIVAVYDTGEGTDSHGNELPFIVMEHVEGQTLRDVTRDGRRILPERSLGIVAEVLGALDYSHRQGIIHRDIKPANVMLTPGGQVKVMDFGIARALADSSLTQTAAVIGTAQYLSPEQARGETVDARSDIYSTGCLLYELLTGRPPFVGDSPVSVAYQHVREDARPPSQFNPDVSQNIDHIVAKALAKKTSDRYQSAGDMRTDIQRAISGESVAAPAETRVGSPGQGTAVAPAAGSAAAGAAVGALAGMHASPNTQVTSAVPPAGATSVGTGAPVLPPPRTNRRADEQKKWPWIVAGVVLLALIGGGAWALMGGGGDTEGQEVPDVVGSTFDDARSQLEGLGFKVEREDQDDETVAKDEVIDQDPGANSTLEAGGTVTLTVSSGTEQVQIPQLSGYSFDDAQKLLESKGLVVVKKESNSSEDEDQVINSNPPAGDEVDKGSTVTLIVSNGKADKSVPNVVGMTGRDAKRKLKDAGFDVSVDGPLNGTVTDQDPGSGDTASEGDTVSITTEAKDSGDDGDNTDDGGGDTSPDPSDSPDDGSDDGALGQIIGQ